MKQTHYVIQGLMTLDGAAWSRPKWVDLAEFDHLETALERMPDYRGADAQELRVQPITKTYGDY